VPVNDSVAWQCRPRAINRRAKSEAFGESITTSTLRSLKRAVDRSTPAGTVCTNVMVMLTGSAVRVTVAPTPTPSHTVLSVLPHGHRHSVCRPGHVPGCEPYG
jgi:hypothetical protein